MRHADSAALLVWTVDHAAVLCCAVLCCAVLRGAVLRCAVLRCAVIQLSCHVMSCHVHRSLLNYSSRELTVPGFACLSYRLCYAVLLMLF